MDQNSAANSLSSDAPGQVVDKVQIAMRHPVGQRLQLKVGAVTAYGFFSEIEPGTGFDALCHQNHIRGLNGRSPQEVFTTGQPVECTVHSVNFGVDGVRVQLACDVPPATEMTNAEAVAVASSLREIAQWVLGHPTQAQALFSGLKAAVQDMPNTRLLLGKFFKPQRTFPIGHANPWAQQNPQISESARAWLRERVRECPLHASVLGEIAKRFGVPKPVSRWVASFPEFAVVSAAHSPIRQPAVALRDKLDDGAYWGKFSAKGPLEEMPATKALPMQEDNVSPVSQGRGGRILVDGSNFIRASTGPKGLEAILSALKSTGRSPLVVFDASTPWRVDEAGKAFVERLVDSGEATIVPGGSQADDYLLLIAEKSGGEIVSNDLFRDHLARHPWLAGDGKGGKRIHTALVADGMVVIPDLGICSPAS